MTSEDSARISRDRLRAMRAQWARDENAHVTNLKAAATAAKAAAKTLVVATTAAAASAATMAVTPRMSSQRSAEPQRGCSPTPSQTFHHGDHMMRADDDANQITEPLAKWLQEFLDRAAL